MGERRQRGSTETTKAVADADHGIADQAAFRGITGRDLKGARAGPRSVHTVDCPGGVRRDRAGEQQSMIRKSAWAVFHTSKGCASTCDDTKWNANRLLCKTAARQPGSARRSHSRVPP
jgi:hypothetical protein